MGCFDSEDVMRMGYFDFMGLLRILKGKGYELTLYPGDRDNIHIQLTDWDRDTGCAFKVKEMVSLKAIEQYKSDPNYILCNIFLGLMNRLDSRTQGFKHYTESVGNQDDKFSKGQYKED